MNSPIQIGNRQIGREFPPLIIAELSGNHNGSLDRAFEIVDAAAAAGAHAIKLQTYTADTMTLDVKSGEFSIDDEQSLWDGSNLYDLYKTASTPWEWHAPIMERAKASGLLCFSSPFDETAVDFLEELDVPAYKIASFEIVHLPLIRKVAATRKPMIISTGMATVGEIEEAVATFHGQILHGSTGKLDRAARAARSTDLANDRKHDIFGRNTGRQLSIDTNLEVLRFRHYQALRCQHMLHIRGTNTKCERTKGPVRGGM